MSKHKPGYKKTKLGWIPEEWEILKIKDIFTFLSTTSFSRNDLHYKITPESVFYIHYGDIHTTYKNNILDFEKEGNIPTLLQNNRINSNAFFLRDGDLIIADASEDYEGVGVCIELRNIGNRKAISGLHTLAIRDKNSSSVPGFRPYIFKNKYVSTALKKIATGSKVYGISKTNLSGLEIVLPPLPEQQKIAEILGTWDKAIEKYELLIRKYEIRKKGLMQLLLTGEIRFPAFVKTPVDKPELGPSVSLPLGGDVRRTEGGKEGYKKTKLGWIPEDWETKKLGKIGVFFKGKGISKGEIVSKGYPCLTYGEIYTKHNFIIKTFSSYINEESTKESIEVHYGDILFAGSGETLEDIGKCVAFTNNFKAFAGGDVIIFRQSKNHPEYLGYLLNQDIVNKQKFSLGQGHSVVHIYSSSLSKVIVPLPSLQEQQKIASVLFAADKEIEILQKQLERLKEQKKGLMQVLLTGKVRVRVNENKS